MIHACEKHKAEPVKGYSPCPGCEVEGLRERIAELERRNAELTTELGAKQAEIDRLMLEYCPGEMTVEQVEDGGRHQRPVTVDIGCTNCGSTSIHACPGQPIEPWTPEKVAELHRVLDEYFPPATDAAKEEE